uniref:ODAD1 central coiled coil region domain-containing protein n=1 Tax=Hanusia phi TaxID=3032 RepID=A0A7S0F434_9CRYP|mmetsp:Transcript_3679/g.9114  ORF Transcript_3679/g.9114 Transcript_3679/m.9114 type:complete len:169 (+) Transcript_3679:20-526(+)|eukprot:642353-Hanusia_phi.AAC.4
MQEEESRRIDGAGHVDDGIHLLESTGTTRSPHAELSEDELDLNEVEDPEGTISELMERLNQVMSALNETEEENARLQDEIQHLLDEQDEQQELRTELGEQLLERRDLMAKIAAQARADNNDSESFLKRMRELMEESDREKQDFKHQMERLDKQLADLSDDESGGVDPK